MEEEDDYEYEAPEPAEPEEPPAPPPPPEPEPEPEPPRQRFASADSDVKSDATAGPKETWEPWTPPVEKSPEEPVDSDYGFSDIGVPVGARTAAPRAPKETWEPWVEPEGPAATVGRGLAHQVIPTAAAIATGVLTSPGGPWVAIPAAIGAYAATEYGQGKLLDKTGYGDEAQMEANRRANPKSAMVGDFAGAAIPWGVGKKAELVQRGIGAGIGGVIEGGSQVMRGELDLPRLGAAVGTGAVFNTPRAGTAYVERQIASGAARVTGRPEAYAPYTGYTPPPQPYIVPEPPQPAQGRMPFDRGNVQAPLPYDARGTPQMSYQDWTRMGVLAERSNKPNFSPAEQKEYNALLQKESTAREPKLPEIGGGESQLGLPLGRQAAPEPMTAVDWARQRELAQQGTNLTPAERTEYAALEGKARAAAEAGPAPRARLSEQPELGFDPPVHAPPLQGQLGFNITTPEGSNRPGMPPTAGVAREAAPPAGGGQPRNYPRYAKWPEAPGLPQGLRGEPSPRPHSLVEQGMLSDVPPQQARGININQPGQGDPDIRHALGVQAKPRPSPRPPAPEIERGTAGRLPDWQGPPAPIPRNQQLVPRPPDSTQGMTEARPQPNMVRLYRTDPQAPRAFTTDRNIAQRFGPLRHVDVRRGELAAQFKPGEAPSSFVAHPIWAHPKYQRRVRPTLQLPTQPTRRQWPRPPGEPPPPSGGPPPPPPPPPTRGGPEPAGRPPTGVRESDPQLDAAVARVVPSAGMTNQYPPGSRGWANWLLNRKPQLNAEAAKQGMRPEEFAKGLKAILDRPEAAAAPAAKPAAAKPAAAKPAAAPPAAAKPERIAHTLKPGDKVTTDAGDSFVVLGNEAKGKNDRLIEIRWDNGKESFISASELDSTLNAQPYVDAQSGERKMSAPAKIERAAEAAPPVDLSVKAARERADVASKEKAAPAAAPAAREPLTMKDWGLVALLKGKRGLDYEAKKRGMSPAELRTEVEALRASAGDRNPDKEWKAFLDKAEKVAGSKAEEFRGLGKLLRSGKGSTEDSKRHSQLYNELNAEWVAQWEKGAKPAAEASAKPDWEAINRARYDEARARHESDYAGLSDQQKKFFDAAASPKGGEPGISHNEHMRIARAAKSVKEARAMATESAKPENMAARAKARNPELYPDLPAAPGVDDAIKGAAELGPDYKFPNNHPAIDEAIKLGTDYKFKAAVNTIKALRENKPHEAVKIAKDLTARIKSQLADGTLEPVKPVKSETPAAREPVPHVPQQKHPNRLEKNGTGSYLIYDKNGNNLGALEKDFSTGGWEIRRGTHAPDRYATFNEARAEVAYLTPSTPAPSKSSGPSAPAPPAPPREKPPPDTTPKKFGVAPELADAAIATSKAKEALGSKPAADGPTSLYSHIRALGGIIPDDKGELAAAFGGKKSGLYLQLARTKEKGGMPLDRILENVARGAPEERYFHEGASIRELLDALRGSQTHLPEGAVAKETSVQRERADFEEARHTDTRKQVEKDIDEWVESPDHDYYDPGMRDRMVELLEQGKASDPADAHAKAVEEWDVKQMAFEGDVGPPKDIPEQLPEKSVDNKLQEVIPGAGKDMKTAAQRAADAPLKPKEAQKGSDFGMFADRQNDMFDTPAMPKEEPGAKVNPADALPGASKGASEAPAAKTPPKKDTKEIDRLQQKYFDANRQLQNLEKQVKGGALEDTDPKYLNARRAAEDAINAWHEAEGIPLKKPSLIDSIKDLGKNEKGGGRIPSNAEIRAAIKSFFADERGGGPKKGPVQPIVVTHMGTQFKGATVDEAAKFAKAAGFKSHQIFTTTGQVYSPSAAAAAPAAATGGGGGTTRPPPPTGGTPPPPAQPPRRGRTADEEAILGRIANPESWTDKVPRTKSEANEAWRAYYTEAKNAMDPIEQLSKLLGKPPRSTDKVQQFKEDIGWSPKARAIAFEDDPGVLARLTKGLGGRFQTQLGIRNRITGKISGGTYDINTGRRTGDPMETSLSAVREDPQGFAAYIIARRAADLHAEGKQTGMDPQAVNNVIARGGNQWGPVAQELYSFKDRVLDNLTDVMGAKAVAAFKANNPSHVPFYRAIPPESELGRMLGAGLTTTKPIHEFKGSGEKIYHPLDTVPKNVMAFTDIAERNRVGMALEDLNARLPADKKFMVQVRDTHPVTVSPEEVNRLLRKEGIPEEVVNSMTIFRPDFFKPTETRIRVYRDGKAKVYEVDPKLGKAWNSLDQQTLPFLIKLFSVPARALRAGAVTNLEFILRNLTRDQITAAMQSPHGYIPYWDFGKALGHIFTGSEQYHNWLRHGGANANLVSVDRRIINVDPKTLGEKFKNVVTSPFHALQLTSELVENATRLGVAMRAVKKGASWTEGTFQSREATLDFQRVGNSMRAVNNLVAFFNARYEGVDRLARAFRDNPGKSLSVALASVTLPSVALWFNNKDDPRVQELERWEKDIFWIIPTTDWRTITPAVKDYASGLSAAWKRTLPDGTEQYNAGTLWRWPKPFAEGVFFGSIPERILDAYYKNDPKAFDDLTKVVRKALNLEISTVTPQVAIPFIEQFANQSMYFERPLMSEKLAKGSPEKQVNYGTSEVAKNVGSAIRSVFGEKASGGSPIVIDNYIRAWSGGFGQYIVNIADRAIIAGEKAVTGKERAAKADATLADIVGVRAFTSRFPRSQTESVREFYKEREIRRMEKTDFDAMKKTDPEAAAAREIQGGLETGNKVAKAMTELRGLVDEINRDPKMSPENKRMAIDLTWLTMIEYARIGLEDFKADKRNRNAK